MAEQFVKAVKRGHLPGAVLRGADSVLLRPGQWIDDYKTRAPYSALGRRSPAGYRIELQASSSGASEPGGLPA